MSASRETTNYKLPLFADDDQPTWLGDFNNAMGKIDTGITTVGANASTALSAANNAVNRVGQVETTIDAVQTTANNAYRLSTANEKEISALDGQVAQLETKFPIASGNLSNGAVTAAKLDQTAIAAMWAGLTVKRFSTDDSGADNAGMAAPAGAKFEGFYLAELGILVINKMSAAYKKESDASFTLPSYIPNFATSGIVCEGAFAAWNSSTNFLTWTSLYTTKGTRNVGLATYPGVGNSFTLLGSAVVYAGTNAGVSLSEQDAYQRTNPTIG